MLATITIVPNLIESTLNITGLNGLYNFFVNFSWSGFRSNSVRLIFTIQMSITICINKIKIII
jgi:hypothetical protein